MESTAIYLACGNKDDNTVKYLIEHGADPNISNRDGVSPLHVLVRHGYLRFVTSSKYFDLTKLMCWLTIPRLFTITQLGQVFGRRR